MKKSSDRLEMMRRAKREKVDRLWRRLIGDLGEETPRRVQETRRARWAR